MVLANIFYCGSVNVVTSIISLNSLLLIVMRLVTVKIVVNSSLASSTSVSATCNVCALLILWRLVALHSDLVPSLAPVTSPHQLLL